MTEIVERAMTAEEIAKLLAERDEQWKKLRAEQAERARREESGEHLPPLFLAPQPYYQNKGVTLYCDDCLKVMRALPTASFELVFTSPPYNLGVSTGGGMSRASAKTSRWKSAKLRSGYEEHADAMPWPEYVKWQGEVLLECWRLLSDTGAIFYNHKPRVQAGQLRTVYDLNPGLPLRQIVIWCRRNGFQFNVSFYRPAHEWIAILAKPGFRLREQGLLGSGVGDVWHIPAETDENPHPAPFPVQLPLMALQTTVPGRVLDPFCGSGTTGVAARLTNREFVGIDNSELYCGVARERLERVGSQPQQQHMEVEAI